MFSKKFLRILVALFFTSYSMPLTFAQDMSLLGDIKVPQQAAEYIFRSSPKESLISVQLLGAVNKPGVYYIPSNTDLLRLLTIAGGTTNGGDLSEVLVRKVEPKQWADFNSKAIKEYQGAYEIDAEKIIKHGGGKNLKLQQDDFVYVPPRTPWISTEASRNVTIVSVVLGIVLTAVLIDKNTERK